MSMKTVYVFVELEDSAGTGSYSNVYIAKVFLPVRADCTGSYPGGTETSCVL